MAWLVGRRGRDARLPYAAGLSLETVLWRRLSLEVEGIYRPLHAVQQYQFTDGGHCENPFTVLTWQIPVIAKYRWNDRRVTPFVEGGPSFRLSGNTNGYQPSRFGVTAGMGVEAALRGVRLSPAVRYTGWDRDANRLNGAPNDTPRTAQNQVELLFGFSF